MMQQFETWITRDGKTLLTRLVPDFDRFWGFRRVVRDLSACQAQAFNI